MEEQNESNGNTRKQHANEIIIWANSPEGTKVWCRRKKEKRWLLMQTPSWNKDNDYVINGTKAERRKRKIENKST